ncbi:MAG: T9SS type A sorting domain-containing protein [Bacteroidia bacterium]|nr:T9SS type A sorting domain-containing protein [Bacteroidia bacterium]
MKKLGLIILGIFPYILLAQYSETFSTAGKGLQGACSTADASSCSTNDFSGVNWSLSGDASGLVNTGDFFITTGGTLTAQDIDNELCWTSPTLDIDIGGNVSISIDATWAFYESGDYVDMEYSIDGGSFTPIPNYSSGLTTDNTIDGSLIGGGQGADSRTISITGLSGSTMVIRICADHNSTSETTTFDNISVPEVGVTLLTLPVTWGSFLLKRKNPGVELSWTTHTELNNQGFEVLRSTDTKEWETIGMEKSQGNSQAMQAYTFFDVGASNKKLYYRLRQVDIDGTSTLSQIKQIQLKEEAFSLGNFAPNPSTGIFNFEGEIPSPGELSLEAMDINGRKIWQSQHYFSEAGTKVISADWSSLPRGLYFLKAQFQNYQQTELIILR